MVNSVLYETTELQQVELGNRGSDSEFWLLQASPANPMKIPAHRQHSCNPEECSRELNSVVTRLQQPGSWMRRSHLHILDG